MCSHARLWLLRRSLALEISSKSKKQSRRSRLREWQSDISSVRYIILFVNLKLSMAHSSWRNVEGGNCGTAIKEEEGIERRRRGTRRTRIKGTNEREESRCVYERRTTFCRTSLLACRPILRVFRAPPSAPRPFGSHRFLLVFPGLP